MRARRAVPVFLAALLLLAPAGVAAAERRHPRTRPAARTGAPARAVRTSSSPAARSRPPAGRPSGRSVVPASRIRSRRLHGGDYYGWYGYGPGWYDGWGWPYWGWYDGWGWPYWGWYGWWGWPCWDCGYAGAPEEIPGRRAAPAVVETDIRPRNAEVVLDGTEIGRAGRFNRRWDDGLWLRPGRYVLEFRAPGHQILRVEFRARAGRYYRFNYDLRKGEGLDPRSVRLPKPKPEKEAGPAPRAPPEAPPAGEALKRGFLGFHVSPADAAVYLDGKFLARAGELSRLHGAVPVATGVHRVEVVRPGYEARTLDVEVSEAETSPVDVALEREPGR